MDVCQHQEQPQPLNRRRMLLTPRGVMSEDELSALAMRGVSSTDIREEIENRCDRAARASARARKKQFVFAQYGLS